MTNYLDQAGLFEQHAARFGDPDDAMARYGADLLGRAIGHELVHAAATQAPAHAIALRTGYAKLIAELIPHPTRRIMAMYAIADVQNGL